MKSILFISPIRKGGPFFILKKLHINIGKIYRSEFHASFKGFILGFFSKKDMIHTSLPVFINFFKKKIILHIHGDYNIERNLFRNPLGFFFPLAIYFSNCIVVPSIYLKKKLNLKKAIVIPNFVDDSIFHFRKKNYSIHNKINCVIMTKFHFKEKAEGVVSLVNILIGLDLKRDIELNVLGSGRYLQGVQEKVNNLLKNNTSVKVNFLGFINDPYQFIKEQDIFTYYSNLDTFGVAILESLSIGVPTITNEFGAAAEIITDGEDGYVAKNKKDYSLKLKKLILSVSIRKNFSNNSVLMVKNNFSQDKICSQFIDLYEQIYK
jgi:glycosyltransferase involved in cell wall biosynthesis